MRDLFTLGDEYANATETSEIFASVNGEVTATLAAEQAPMPELNHAEGLCCAYAVGRHPVSCSRCSLLRCAVLRYAVLCCAVPCRACLGCAVNCCVERCVEPHLAA